MKVLHLSSEKTWRGGEQQMAYLIAESIKHNIEPLVACRKGSAFSTYCKQQKIKHYDLGFRNEIDVFTALKLLFICKKEHIGILHAHSSHSQAMAVLSAFFGNKTPIVLSRKVDFAIKNNVLSKWKFNHKSIKRIICVSNAIKEILLPDLKRTNHLSVIHDGIDLKRFPYKKGQHILRKEYSIDNNKQIIANISAIAPHKDYFTFVDTAEIALSINPNLHFFIIGDGPLRNEIEAYVSNKNLADSITLTGFRNDIPQLFPDIDVFLMTSKTEGLGSTLLDAACNFIPIVSTDAGGIPEFIIHQETGLLTAVGDSKALAQGIIYVLQDDALQKKLTNEAYLKLLEGFTKEKMALKTIEIYGKL